MPEWGGQRLRQAQAEILDYQGGTMGVSAVPGSGKTFTLSLLATRLITEGRLGPDGDVLVVTVQNSAVANVSSAIAHALDAQRFPAAGYHVCTLHKLAADILRARHDLAGVEQGFFVIDDAESRRMMHNAADVFIAGQRPYWRSFMPDAEEGRLADMEKRWRAETERIGREVAKLCKHLRLSPEQASALVPNDAPADAFCRMGVEMYALYEQYLQARGGLDFDDLIWRAIRALDQDVAFVENLRRRWPVILEDEAQDSSPLQEEILSRLAGPGGNWVRVGDPNQSINATFTAADPRYFRRFLRENADRALTLPETGRCGQPIMDLANHLVAWACEEHPELEIRLAAFEPQEMRATLEGDPQQNPPAEDCHIHIPTQPLDDNNAEAATLARWASNYLRRNPQDSVAVLCPASWQGGKVIELLLEQAPDVTVVDLLKSTPRTRRVAKVLASACRYLSSPASSTRLGQLYRVLAEAELLGDDAEESSIRRRATLARSVAPEDLLYPRDHHALQERMTQIKAEADDVQGLVLFARKVRRWVNGVALPIDQLLLSIAQDLYADDRELAICHAIASSMESVARMQPDWRLPEFAQELDAIVSNRRGLPGLSLADTGYGPQPGAIVVTTLHKSKGLEWDTVYIMSADSLEFPSTCEDAFRGGLYFMPEHLPSVEARKRLEQLAGAEFAGDDAADLVRQARLETIAERLRLLYVGITRARRNLAMTHTKRNSQPVVISEAVAELARFKREERL